jgi:hypothetical protein
VRVPTGGTYGSATQLAQLQQAAPLAASPGGDGAQAAPVNEAAAKVIPFGAPTQQPDVPVTAGAASGAGPGLEALGLPSSPEGSDLQKYAAWLPVLEHMANQPGASSAARNIVRQLKGLM